MIVSRTRKWASLVAPMEVHAICAGCRRWLRFPTCSRSRAWPDDDMCRARSGVRSGDTIFSVVGSPIHSIEAVRKVVRLWRTGQTGPAGDRARRAGVHRRVRDARPGLRHTRRPSTRVGLTRARPVERERARPAAVATSRMLGPMRMRRGRLLAEYGPPRSGEDPPQGAARGRPSRRSSPRQRSQAHAFRCRPPRRWRAGR